ncbi:MAG TPA: hypothetical protein VI544_00710 [Candidatus Nanoarchaeia archaeon]|nr:hypothetical protein [Candidatus Nanoarchaeia archaeon]
MPSKKRKNPLAKIDYDTARGMIHEACDDLEPLEIFDKKLISFRDYITPKGIVFPNRDAEEEFRKRISYREEATETEIALSYLNLLNRTLNESNHTVTRSLEDAL